MLHNTKQNVFLKYFEEVQVLIAERDSSKNIVSFVDWLRQIWKALPLATRLGDKEQDHLIICFSIALKIFWLFSVLNIFSGEFLLSFSPQNLSRWLGSFSLPFKHTVVLLCIILYYFIVYYILWYCIVLHYIVLYS